MENPRAKYECKFKQRGWTKKELFFSMILTTDDQGFFIFSDLDFYYTINPYIFLMNRKAEQIFFLANDQMLLAMASICGFCIIPFSDRSGEELKLTEKYLFEHRFYKSQLDLNRYEFKFLTKNIKGDQSLSLSSASNESANFNI